jgi:uncharacterized LabA/DUF88 family protein
MSNIAILLDGDATRRLVKRWIGKNPTPLELREFCEKFLINEESVFEAIYYDCKPFGETKTLPISGNSEDFSTSDVYKMATSFQSRMEKENYFKLRLGSLSFDGWQLQNESLIDLARAPRKLHDSDFKPLLRQKQVDMKIALDVSRLTLGKKISRILLLTCDSDFIPTIDHAQNNGVDVALILDRQSIVKKELKNACKFRRYAEDYVSAIV